MDTMKTKLLVLIAFVLLGANTWGQSSPNQATQTKKPVQSLNSSSKEDNVSSQLFKVVPNSTAVDVEKDIKNAVFLEINFDELARINKIRPSLLTLNIPLSENSNVSFNLHDAKIMANTFSVVTGKNEKVKYNPGLYYQGTVSGISPSLAGWSMFDNSIMGVFSYNHDNWVLGLYDHPTNTLKNIYILYKDSDVQFAREFKCETDQLPSKMGGSGSGNSENLLSTNCIKIYFECDYQMFVDKGSVINVVNYVTGMFNVVQVLFNNEVINTELSEVYVWSATDPYISNSTSSDYLNDFQATRTTFNGDLAHLLTTRTINVGGVAYLDVICSPGKGSSYGFSNISNTYNLYPTYSNTILIVTHELGHNFGSEHTHWCGWPGGPIDNCVPVDDGPCTAGPGPINGGTIMSYCHLSGPYPLSNGFGPLPGNQIRSRYAAATCLTACDSPPDAAFAGTPLTSCTAPLTVTFTDQTVGATTGWAWDIDNDGITDYTTQSPTHTYSATGTYTVRLIASNVNGSDTIIKVNYITVGSVTPAVTTAITTGSNSICGGTTVTFTATPVNGGASPTYIWYLNGAPISGAISSTYTTGTLANGDVITCQVTSNAPCASPATAISTGITMTVTPSLVPEINVTITSGTASICVGESVTFSASSVNGGNGPVYQWQLNGANVGTNATTHTAPVLANGDVVTCILTSNATCASPTTITSSIITISVSPMTNPTVSIAITSGTNPTCMGVPVTFNATSTNGGLVPVYQWKINGVSTVIGTSYTPTSLANNDVITCTVTSNASCLSTTTATSAGTTIALIPSPPPTVAVAITTGTNPSCYGSSATFTATPANAGTGPAYQWLLNGNPISGAQSSTYTPPTIADGSIFSCNVISNSTCPGTAISNGITVIVPPVSTINFISDIDVCGGTIAATVFSGNPSGAVFAWTNSNTAIGIASSGTGNIPSFEAGNITGSPITSTVNVTPSVSGCPGTPSSYTITINPTPVITQSGSTLTSSSGTTYQWYLNGQPIAGATSQSCIAKQNGDYSVIINGGGCPSADVPVNVSGIEQLNNDYFFTVSPNPNDGNFFVSFDVSKRDNYTLKIINVIGELVYEETLKDFEGTYSKQMNFGAYAKGSYLINLSSSDRKIVKKVVIY